MKLIFAIIFMAALTAAAGTETPSVTYVRHPIALDDQQSTPISVINHILPANRQLPEYFQASSLESSDQIIERWTILKAEVNETLELYAPQYKDNEIQLGIIPTAVDSDQNKTCYIGDAKVAKDVALKLVGFEFTEQLTIWAYRIGNEAWVDSNLENEVQNENFKTYQTNSNDIFMLGSYSDGGDDENEIRISPCR